LYGPPGYTVAYEGNGPYIEVTHLSYPTHLHRQHISAVLNVRFVVEANGTIDNVQLIRAWTNGGKPIGDAMQEVTNGMMHWKVKPILVDGHPVATPMIVPLSFIDGLSIDEAKPDYGMAIAGDSPNSGQVPVNIPESGTVAQ
jgi:hypothetical protein